MQRVYSPSTINEIIKIVNYLVGDYSEILVSFCPLKKTYSLYKYPLYLVYRYYIYDIILLLLNELDDKLFLSFFIDSLCIS